MEVREGRPVAAPQTFVRWGALFGGFVVLTGIGWLLTMLGVALGFTIADASDTEALGAGFGVGTALWFVLSWVVAYFLGALVTSRLAATADRDVGMLHGLTLWGLGSTVSVLFAFGLLGGGDTTASSSTKGVTQGLGAAPVALAMATSDDFDGAISELGAADVEVPPFVENAAQRIAATVKREAVQILAAESSMSKQEAREALGDLDAELLRSVAGALIDGEPERAKDIIAANTALGDAQIDSLIAKADEKVSNRIDEVQEQLLAAAEAASTYVSSALWAVFVACAAALAAAIGGGIFGATSTREHHVTTAA